jgi:cytochrome c oxidase cbb3-type subunit 3
MLRRIGAGLLVFAAGSAVALAQPAGRRAHSPAAKPIPETASPQSYPEVLAEAGAAVFAAQCGFCHGRDATGGAGGADLTRSELVAQDVRGDRIGQVVRNGRADAGMPAFATLSQDELDGIVAFIHTQKTRAESLEGGRRGVETDDLLSGNEAAGRRFFEANCSDCHSATGDLAGIASRMEGLRLLQRMLYPRPASFGERSVRAESRVSVTAGDGRVYSGVLDYQDEFTIALIDDSGRYRSFSARNVRFEIDNPLEAHLELLGVYTDKDMHDVITYLHTLR